MRTAALAYAGSLSPHALRPLASGASAFERSLSFARRLPGIERVLVAEGAVTLPETGYPVLRRETWTLPALLDAMEEASAGVDALFVFWADQPFLDLALAARMLEDFRRYRAEYGFADGYPVGLSTEIVSPRIIPALRALSSSMPSALARDTLFSVIQKDINSFDIETDISPRDLRDLRLVLACDSKRNSLLVERLMAAGAADAPSALEIIPQSLASLRTLPAFVQIQVSGACPQSCSYCAYPSMVGDPRLKRDFMARESFSSILDQVEALCEDATIDISLWGEPSLHPEIGRLIDDVLAKSGFTLIIETSGLGWDRELVRSLSERHGDRLRWVVALDAASAESYARLRGLGFEEAVSFADYLISLAPGRAYPQMVRMRENETELEPFWRGWKKKTDGVIIQKYSTCAGALPARKVSDLSPLARRPCWHLKRDLSVLLDGTIPLCKDCVRGEIVLGNAFEAADTSGQGGVARAWAAGERWHAAHIDAGDSSGSYPSPCEACDEFYTYNA